MSSPMDHQILLCGCGVTDARIDGDGASPPARVERQVLLTSKFARSQALTPLCRVNGLDHLPRKQLATDQGHAGMPPETAQHDRARFIQKRHLGEIDDDAPTSPVEQARALPLQAVHALLRERALHPQDRAVRLWRVNS